MLNRLPMLLTSVAVGIVFAGAALMLIGSEAKAKATALVAAPVVLAAAPSSVKVNETFLRITEQPQPPQEIAKAITEIRKLQKDGEVRNGADYFLAAVVASKGKTVEDALYAHDLAVCALALGDSRAAAWAALTQDQLLTRLNQKQRYGTQAKNRQLIPVSADVADGMRLIVGLPSLIAAKRMAESGQSLDPIASNIMARMRQLELPTATLTVAD